MKIARITHWRCGQPIGQGRGENPNTYVWIPADLSQEEFERLVEKAKRMLLDADAELRKGAPKSSPGYGGSIYGYADDVTVGQIKREHFDLLEEWRKHDEIRKKASQPFAWYLSEVSGGIIKPLTGDEESVPKVDLDWGHAHGVVIDHSTNETDCQPLVAGDDDRVENL